jgi:MarR family transcriptional regulator, lower aerobic nicotinate degradation pathway regulator
LIRSKAATLAARRRSLFSFSFPDRSYPDRRPFSGAFVLDKKNNRTVLTEKGSLKAVSKPSKSSYIMEDQAGFLMRLANQRHASIFMSKMIGGLTTTQFAALAKLHSIDKCSQNELGRLTSMDAPTIKGVVDRLSSRGLVEIVVDPRDKRRRSISLSGRGRELVEKAFPVAAQITKATLNPIPLKDQDKFLKMLRAVGRDEPK